MHESVSENSEVLRMQQAIARATEAVAGDPNDGPLKVFPNPKSKERREDVVFDADNLSSEQEACFRAAMAELGPGREDDKGLDISRLSNEGSETRNPDHDPDKYEWEAVLEGGQGHKVKSELDLVLEQDILPGMIVLSGSPDRILPDAEKEITAKVLGIKVSEVADTELGVERQVAECHKEFVADSEETPLPTDLAQNPDRYGVAPEHVATDGQFTRIGTIRNIPIVLMRTDRFPDPEGVKDYIATTNAEKISMVRAVQNNAFDRNIALVTSATYEPSCELEALEAVENLPVGTTAQVISYGTKRLAKVKGEEEVKPPALNQLAGTAYKTAEELQKFQ